MGLVVGRLNGGLIDIEVEIVDGLDIERDPSATAAGRSMLQSWRGLRAMGSPSAVTLRQPSSGRPSGGFGRRAEQRS